MSAYLTTIMDDAYGQARFTTLEDCFQQGQAAADQCYKRDHNPYPAGTARREWWDAGWSHSMDELTGA
jgi:ribosome modulation factor